MRTRWIVSMGLAAALCGAPALAQSPAPVITLGFKADVQADGVPTNIQPDAALSPPLQAMVRKRVAEWRYRMGTWQGKPVAATVSQQITAEAVPVNGGGFALRIKSVAYPSVRADSAAAAEKKPRMVAPVYPAALAQRGVQGVLVYAYAVDAAGKAVDVELVHPQQPDRDFKLLDAASRDAIAKSRMPPTKVGGEPVPCRVLTPITFSTEREPPKGPDLSTYRAGHPELCPLPPELLTDVAGTML
ncbi:energy transducer TonB [Thermomonas mangrovi]|uniref:energy transducer TonB n=1 Tax=Thermomonas mangrovi TaxID=2993316 RepID=UPI002307528E|nr:energy transducer TonB [Thermomonas mangrovi]